MLVIIVNMAGVNTVQYNEAFAIVDIDDDSRLE